MKKNDIENEIIKRNIIQEVINQHITEIVGYLQNMPRESKNKSGVDLFNPLDTSITSEIEITQMYRQYLCKEYKALLELTDDYTYNESLAFIIRREKYLFDNKENDFNDIIITTLNRSDTDDENTHDNSTKE